MAEQTRQHPTQQTKRTSCPQCQPQLYQCQQSTCLQWQPPATQCRHCHQPLTGPRSDKQYLWQDQYLWIRERLGSGGMGEVYHAWLTDQPIAHTNTPHHTHSQPREVAVKFNREIAQTERFERFKREVQHLTRLQSPHCVEVLGYGEHNNGEILEAQFMLMEQLHGTLLSTLLAKGPIPTQDALAICTQLCEALSHIHQQDVIHRDLKPDNIMLVHTPNNTTHIKIFDFGLAKDLNLSASAASGSGIVMGTPWYMSPEQAKGEHIDQRSDLFSLGIILYEMLTGQRPFPANTLFELFQLHLQPPPPIPQPLPSPLPAILRGTLTPKPEDRFPDIQHCLQRINDRQHGTFGYFTPVIHAPLQDPLSHNPDTEPLPPPLPSWLLALLIVFVLGSGCLAYFFFIRAQQTPTHKQTKRTIAKRIAPTRSTKQIAKQMTKRPTTSRQMRIATRRPAPPRATQQKKHPVAISPRRRTRRRRRNTNAIVRIVTQPRCQTLIALPEKQRVPATRMLQRKPGRYQFRCISPKIRLDRTFYIDVTPQPPQQVHRHTWQPIRIKILLPRWAYPSIDAFPIPGCTIGCSLTLWSGKATLVLKRPIVGTKRRVIVHTSTLMLPKTLRNAPATKRTFTIRWDEK